MLKKVLLYLNIYARRCDTPCVRAVFKLATYKKMSYQWMLLSKRGNIIYFMGKHRVQGAESPNDLHILVMLRQLNNSAVKT